MVRFGNDSTLLTLIPNTMTKITKIINTLFYISFGISIGFLIANVFATPTEFSEVAWSVIIAVMSAIISIFIDFLIQPGEIFEFWFRFLQYLDNPKNPFRAFMKPLGGCLYCMNVWVSIICFIVFKNSIAISWWYLLPTAAIAHTSLALLEREVNS